MVSYPSKYPRDFLKAAFTGKTSYFKNLVHVGNTTESADEQYRIAKIFDIDANAFNFADNSAYIAYALYLKAANKGHMDAQYAMALYFKNGNPTLKIQQDYTKAIRYLILAVQKNYRNTPAMLCISEMYKEGQGVRADISLSDQWTALAKAEDANAFKALYRTLYNELYPRE